MKTLAQILAGFQASVADLVSYVGGSVPPSGIVPQNIADAMAQVQATMATLTSTAQTAPFSAPNTLQAFTNLQTAVSALGNAIALPSAVNSQPYNNTAINPATGQPYNNTVINPATGQPFNSTAINPATGQPFNSTAINPATGQPFYTANPPQYNNAGQRTA